jgi:hypothetical protein
MLECQPLAGASFLLWDTPFSWGGKTALRRARKVWGIKKHHAVPGSAEALRSNGGVGGRHGQATGLRARVAQGIGYKTSGRVTRTRERMRHSGRGHDPAYRDQ